MLKYRTTSDFLLEHVAYSFKTQYSSIDRYQRIKSNTRPFNRWSPIMNLRYVFRRRVVLKLPVRLLVAVVTGSVAKIVSNFQTFGKRPASPTFNPLMPNVPFLGHIFEQDLM